MIVALNNSGKPQTLELNLSKADLAPAKSLTDRLGELGRLRVHDGSVTLVLPPRSAAVLTRQEAAGCCPVILPRQIADDAEETGA